MAVDDFNRADAASLGANWTTIAGGLRVQSNTAYAGSIGSGLNTMHRSVWAAGVGSPDMAVEAVVSSFPTAGGYADARVVARHSGSGGSSFYELRYNGAGSYFLVRNVGGGETTLANSSGAAISAPETIRLEVEGTGATVTLRVYRGGVLQTTATDTSGSRITAGNTGGIATYTEVSPLQFDTFSVNSLGGGPTTYPVSLSGASTNAGALTRRAGKPLAGAMTSAGALTRRPGKSLAGASSSSGALTRRPAKTLTGAMASAGTLATIKAVLRTFAGSMASAGALARQARKTLAGSLVSAGALTRAATFRRALTGAMASTGVLTRRPGKALAGVLTSSGAMSSTRVVLLTLTGALASTGGLVRRTSKTLAGALTSAAALSLSGGSTPTGWSWLLRRGGVSQPATAKLDGVHDTTTDVT